MHQLAEQKTRGEWGKTHKKAKNLITIGPPLGALVSLCPLLIYPQDKCNYIARSTLNLNACAALLMTCLPALPAAAGTAGIAGTTAAVGSLPAACYAHDKPTPGPRSKSACPSHRRRHHRLPMTNRHCRRLHRRLRTNRLRRLPMICRP